MSTRILLALGAAVALLPGVAGAESGEFTRSGFYLGVGGLYTQNSIVEDQLRDLLPIGIGVNDSWGINTQLGYRAFSFLAAEVEYEYVGSYDISASGIDFLSLEGHVLTGNLKWIMPFWRVQPYLLGGIGIASWNIDDKLGVGVDDNITDLAGRVGGGIDLHLTSRILLNVGADVVFTNAGLSSSLPGSRSVDYLAYIAVGGGLQYRFWGLTGD